MRPAWTILRRGRGWLLTIAIATGVVSGLAGLVWTWLLPPSGGLTASVAFAVCLWVVLFAAGAAVLALVDRRARRRTRLLVLLTIALVVLCGAPPGWFWTFAGDHGPEAPDLSARLTGLSQFLMTGRRWV